ncbi:hypothetical protein AYO21_02167 [Fonsecaea monophora]|uniref:MARVEL domain-containing protein n=1 Tax=Fonsecaea monophora TaxID=254056 RepID=A0A177FIK3_9EURO|nr:hypothetical protein AYO21_02167 [Fonsecaea monophora]KAH0844077.1 hypothetical protein FOPE_09000 [Fonsecaea pedrosoi]OAG43581.1 hypothetical protein AYO21_02167 [Fonsecaea monophora]
MSSQPLQTVPKAPRGGPEDNFKKSDVHISWTEMIPDNLRSHERHASMQKSKAEVNPRREFLQRQYHRFRKWTRIASATTNVISALLSIIMESIMIYTLYKFYATKNLFVTGRPWGPWAMGTILWPTIMLAVASIITSISALVVLCVIWCKAKHKAAYFSLLYALVHIIAWLVVSVVYRVEKTEKDLWGWSCTDKAKAIQQQLGSKTLDFASLCKLQASSWEVSVTEVTIKVLATGVTWYLDAKQKGLKTEIVGDIGSAVFDQITG